MKIKFEVDVTDLLEDVVTQVQNGDSYGDEVKEDLSSLIKEQVSKEVVREMVSGVKRTDAYKRFEQELAKSLSAIRDEKLKKFADEMAEIKMNQTDDFTINIVKKLLDNKEFSFNFRSLIVEGLLKEPKFFKELIFHLNNK